MSCGCSSSCCCTRTTSTPGSLLIQWNGVNLTTIPSSINFTGGGVTASVSGTAVTVTIPEGSGGSGTPSNPLESIQFNDNGSFGGSANLLWDDATSDLTLTGTLNGLYVDRPLEPTVPGNTAVGDDSMRHVAKAGADFFLGNPPVLISAATSGGENTAVGKEAMRELTWGSDNTAIGSRALRDNTYAYYNVAVGHYALGFTTVGWRNTAVGTFSMNLNTIGNQNTAHGFKALNQNLSGSHNVAIGNECLLLNQGDFNTGGGSNTLYNVNTGNYNSAWGPFALYNLTTGSNNVALGYQSGGGITTGSGNTILGANVLGLATNLTNNIILADGTGVIRLQHNGTDWTFPDSTVFRGSYDGSAVAKFVSLYAGNSGSTTQGALIQLATVIGGGYADIYPGVGGTIHLYGSSGSGYIGVSGTSVPTLSQVSPNGAARQFVQVTTTLSGLSGASVTTVGLIPAKVVLRGAVARVTTAITGAASFEIGDGTDVDRYGTAVAIALGTTTSSSNFTADPESYSSSAREITLTANGGNFTGGAVRLVVWYELMSGPTS